MGDSHWGPLRPRCGASRRRDRAINSGGTHRGGWPNSDHGWIFPRARRDGDPSRRLGTQKSMTSEPGWLPFKQICVLTADGPGAPVRLERHGGSPHGGQQRAFTVECQSHDYGYDLIGFAHRTGQAWRPADRLTADHWFGQFMQRVCQKTGWWGLFNKVSCYDNHDLFMAGVQFNTWREGRGCPRSKGTPCVEFRPGQ
jgi:hypothetical protein